jgi:limonene-1,2-epoxide hydrolase
MRLVLDLVDNLRAINLAARQVLDPNNMLRAFLPVQPVEDVRYRLTQSQRVDVVGAVRALGTPSRQIRRPGVTEIRGGLPAISAMESLTETDLVRARTMAGLDVSGELTRSVAASSATTALAVDNSFELLRGSVLATGLLAVDNGEIVQSADFGVPAANRFAAGVSWLDTENATAFDDYLAWAERYLRSAGGPAGACITTRTVWNLFLRNKQVREQFATGGVVPARVRPGDLAELLGSYGAPTMTTYERVIDRQRVWPEGRLTFLPGAGQTRVGSTLLGIPEQTVQLVGAQVLNAAEAPGVSVVTLVQDHPVSRHVNADSLGLPALERPEAIVCAKVLSDAEITAATAEVIG